MFGDAEANDQNDARSSQAGRGLETGMKSRLRGLSVRGELSAHFKDSFQVEVAGIGDMCGPGRRASED